MTIPIIAGMTDLQRNSKKVVSYTSGNKPVFLTQRNTIKSVLLSKETYESLLNSHNSKVSNQNIIPFTKKRESKNLHFHSKNQKEKNISSEIDSIVYH